MACLILFCVGVALKLRSSHTVNVKWQFQLPTVDAIIDLLFFAKGTFCGIFNDQWKSCLLSEMTLPFKRANSVDNT